MKATCLLKSRLIYFTSKPVAYSVFRGRLFDKNFNLISFNVNGYHARNQSSSATAANTHLIDERIIMRRVINTDEIQMMGNMHGGSMMEYIDDVGNTVANQFCSGQEPSANRPPSRCFLTMIEGMEFKAALKIGEVAEFTGQVVATSKHSVNVQVNAFSENPISGVRKLANKASLWYQCRLDNSEDTPTEVPSLSPALPRAPEPEPKSHVVISESYGEGVEEELYTINQSQAFSQYFFLPIHLSETHHCKPGPILRYMDEFGGVVACRYFRYPAVTVGVDNINVISNVHSLSSLRLFARPVYSTERLLDVEVAVDMIYLTEEGRTGWTRAYEGFYSYIGYNKAGPAVTVPPIKNERVNNNLIEKGRTGWTRAYKGFYSYVGYNKAGPAVTVPQIKLKTADEKQRFEERRMYHEQRKQKRKS